MLWVGPLGGLTVQDSGASGAEELQPEPGSHLEAYLVTMGPGDAIWERFSHNAIWIRDTRAGTSLAYNWGIFDFRQEDFIRRLARGRMLYAMMGFDMGRMVDAYRRQNRSVYVNPLNLTPTQRLELQRIVEALDNDEDRYYRYDYYRDNCSTRIRDVLDTVLGGQIQAQTEGTETGTSFRWHTRRLLRPVMWAYFGIQFVLGNPGDEEISAWDEMFLPLILLRRLESFRVTTPDGDTAPLLGEREVLFESARPPEPSDAPSTLLLSLMVGLAVAAGIGLLAWRAEKGSRAGAWGLALFGGGWSLLLGLAGLGLMLAWAFTDHVFWRWNENLFQVNPLGLMVAVGLIGAALGKDAKRAATWSKWAAGLALAGLVLQVLPGFDQVNGDILALTVPAHLALAWGASRLDGA